jgi:protein-L-isoaspartate(D-aspartate) O-methyltransferase
VALTFENKTSGRGAQVLQAMPLDGSRVSALDFELMVKATNIRAGTQQHEIAGGLLHFFDSERRPIAVEVLGPWRGSFTWKQVKRTLHVPPNAKEAILRLGLNGATGTLSVDEITMKPQARP